MSTIHPQKYDEPVIFFHLKWVAKIALGVGILAIAGLLLVLFFITDDRGAEYGRIILNHSLTELSLAPAILVFGLSMVSLAGMLTWLISLYSSFRIAGPLYRFSQNLKNALAHPSAPLQAIRTGDLLQAEWRAVDAGMTRLSEHYADLALALGEAEQALSSAEDDRLSTMRGALARLQEVERRVQL